MKMLLRGDEHEPNEWIQAIRLKKNTTGSELPTQARTLGASPSRKENEQHRDASAEKPPGRSPNTDTPRPHRRRQSGAWGRAASAGHAGQHRERGQPVTDGCLRAGRPKRKTRASNTNRIRRHSVTTAELTWGPASGRAERLESRALPYHPGVTATEVSSVVAFLLSS